MKNHQSRHHWYRSGLHFSCTECGACCTGAPGFVWVTLAEIEALAAHLQLEVETFSRLYLRKVEKRFSLREDPKNGDCCFLKGKKCTVYAVRPHQCRTYPFWPQNLTSPQAWKEAAQECEGIHDEAPLLSYEEIEERRSPTNP